MSEESIGTAEISSNFRPLDLSFLNSGFRRTIGGKPVLRDELLDSRARELGERFAQEEEKRQRARGKRPVDVSMTPAQVRRIFGEVKGLQREVEKATSIDPYLARVRMLKSKVAYASGRDNVTTSFEEFINKCVDLVIDKDSFLDFVLFFESVVGYFQRYKEEGAR